MQKEEDKHGSFTVKYFGNLNPLIINFPQNEYQGAKYIDIEVGSFYWNITKYIDAGNQFDLDVLPVCVKVPGISSGNYDITGKNSDTVTMICPDSYVMATGAPPAYKMNIVSCYAYSPGRPDLYIAPPSPFITIQFTDINGALIQFLSNPYYASFNIGY